MADATQKRLLVNRALLIFSGATTAASRTLFKSGDLETTYFSDPHTNVPSSRRDILCVCVAYEPVLQMVLKDLKPDFARHFADLRAPVRINREYGSWEYLFDGLPSDFLDLIAQVDQNDKDKTYEAEIKTYDSYAHVVSGSDDKAYYCILDHTGSADKTPITGASYATYWSLYDEDDIGATYVVGKAYKASQSGHVLVTNAYSNVPTETVDSDIDSAYIEYLAYVQAGISDKPEYYPEYFVNAFCIRLAAEIAISIGKDYERRIQLLGEYEKIAKPGFYKGRQAKKHVEEQTSIFDARTA